MEIADRQALPLSVPDCVDGMAAAQSAARRQASSPLHPHQGYVIIGVTYIYRANPTYWQIRPARLEPAERPLNNIEKGQEARAMKVLGIVGVISAFGFFGAGPAIGHDCHHDHHWSDCWDCGHYARQSPMPSRGMAVPGGTVALQTIEGKIAEIVYLPGVTENSGLVEIRLQSSTQNRLIRLAPTGFLKARGLLLREGDAVTVKGFPISGMEGDLIVATEVHKGEKTVSLRDESGRPTW